MFDHPLPAAWRTLLRVLADVLAHTVENRDSGPVEGESLDHYLCYIQLLEFILVARDADSDTDGWIPDDSPLIESCAPFCCLYSA